MEYRSPGWARVAVSSQSSPPSATDALSRACLWSAVTLVLLSISTSPPSMTPCWPPPQKTGLSSCGRSLRTALPRMSMKLLVLLLDTTESLSSLNGTQLLTILSLQLVLIQLSAFGTLLNKNAPLPLKALSTKLMTLPGHTMVPS